MKHVRLCMVCADESFAKAVLAVAIETHLPKHYDYKVVMPFNSVIKEHGLEMFNAAFEEFLSQKEDKYFIINVNEQKDNPDYYQVHLTDHESQDPSEYPLKLKIEQDPDLVDILCLVCIENAIKYSKERKHV